jgi:ABC-2 type transport system ATP-binding protein
VLGIDVATRKSVYEILLRDYTEHPRTFIISSHLLSEIESVLSDILLIEQGKVVLHNPLDDVRQSAYRIDGNYVAVESFVRDKKVITLRKNELSCYAIIQEQYNELVVQSAKAQGMSVSTVRAEELCMYLTSQNKEGELECLWQNPS